MTRLQSHQKKQMVRTIIFYSVILICFFIFILTVGLKVLLNASVFIANLTAKKAVQTTSKSDDFIGSVDIDNIPSATNSARIVVSGSILNYDTLTFFINGENIKETNISSQTSFSEEIGDLLKGNNEVYIQAKTKDLIEQKQSQKFTVTYKSDKPKLDIKEPQDNSKTSNTDINVNGSTDKETFIQVNDGPVVVDSQGNFQTSVRLHDGDNKIKITAQDVAGNIEEKTITVTFQKD